MKRRILLLAAVVASLVLLPGSALAAPPSNDEIAGAIPLSFNYSTSTMPNPDVMVPPAPGGGGWEDATPVANAASGDPQPTCATVQGYHSMWYSLQVGEPSVATLTLSTTVNDPRQYQPIVTLYDQNMSPIACGLGGSDLVTRSVAVATSYLQAGRYIVGIASATFIANGDATQPAPTVVLNSTLRDVTPPHVVVELPRKILGPGQKWKFDALLSTDGGSGLDTTQAAWSFYRGGGLPPVQTGGLKGHPETATFAWSTAGLHQVSITLRDLSGNESTYDFFVYVHSFALPKVAVRVFVPAPGAGTIRLVISHDMPVNLRLVIFQGKHLLRAIPRKLVKGSHANTSLVLGLLQKVSKRGGYITVGGTASSLGQYPNTVPLLTCSVDPVHGGGHCA